MFSLVSVGTSPSNGLFLWFLFLAISCLLRVEARNVTIDDQNGDAVTGAKPTYVGTWSFGPTCGANCWIKPDAQDTLDGTWHDTTVFAGGESASITLQFIGELVRASSSRWLALTSRSGTDIYVFGIIANLVNTPSGKAYTNVNLDFSVDGSSIGSYSHTPTTSTDLQYNVPLLAYHGLTNGPHTLVVSLQLPSVILFDYAVYTWVVERARSNHC
jgi:hypothetical protein